MIELLNLLKDRSNHVIENIWFIVSQLRMLTIAVRAQSRKRASYDVDFFDDTTKDNKRNKSTIKIFHDHANENMCYSIRKMNMIKLINLLKDSSNHMIENI